MCKAYCCLLGLMIWVIFGSWNPYFALTYVKDSKLKVVVELEIPANMANKEADSNWDYVIL